MDSIKKSGEELRQALKSFMEEKGLKQAQVKRSLGISEAALSQWLNNCYTGNIPKIEEDVKAFLQRQYEKSALVKVDIPFIETSISKAIFEVARMCHLDCEMGVVYGSAGYGKTFSVKEYARQNPDTILIEVDPGWTARALMRKIHRDLGLDGRGFLDDIVSEIVSRLQNSGRLIIIDEAENLDSDVLNLVRRIYDHANVGLLLVGMPRLLHNLKGKKGEFSQLYSRSSVSYELKPLTSEDTRAIVGAVLYDDGGDDNKPGGNGIYKSFHCAALGNTRVLTKLILRSLRLADVNKAPLSPEIIQETLKLITV